MQNVIPRNIYNTFFQFFDLFLATLASKIATSAEMRKKGLWFAKIQYCYHKKKNSMLISNPLKKFKEVHLQKMYRPKPFAQSSKSQNFIFPCLFLLITIFRVNLQFFLTDSKSSSNSAEKNKSGYTNNDCCFLLFTTQQTDYSDLVDQNRIIRCCLLFTFQFFKIH